jgi:MFS family permease
MKPPALQTLSPQRTSVISWTLLCLMPVLGMAIDLISPSLPAMSRQLSISDGLSQTLISIYLFGLAFGNFFTGFLTEAWGRKILLRSILLGAVIVTVMPVLFPNIHVLLISRLLQGLMFGSYSILMRAIFADILSTDKLVHQGTLIATMWGLSPILGPVIGGYFQLYLGWQANFYILAIVIFLFFLLIFIVVPETHTKPHPLNFAIIKSSLMEILRTPIFVGLGMMIGSTYSLIIVFQTAAPFLIQTTFGHSPVFFGYCALALGVVFLLATFVCRYAIKRIHSDRLLLRSIVGFTLIAVLCLISTCFFQSLLSLEISSGLMFFASGFIFPLALGKGMILSKQTSAVAISVMYLLNILITSLVSFIISLFNTNSAIILVGIYLGLMLLCFLAYWTMVHRRTL